MIWLFFLSNNFCKKLNEAEFCKIKSNNDFFLKYGALKKQYEKKSLKFVVERNMKYTCEQFFYCILNEQIKEF